MDELIALSQAHRLMVVVFNVPLCRTTRFRQASWSELWQLAVVAQHPEGESKPDDWCDDLQCYLILLTPSEQLYSQWSSFSWHICIPTSNFQLAKQGRDSEAGVCLQAHKLLVLADQLDPPKSAEATDALFAATYEEGKNVSDDAEIEKVCALMPRSFSSPGSCT